MSDEYPEAVMMIGLHKLAAQNGDGLVPELYALLTRRERMLEENPNVQEFPGHLARPSARNADAPAQEVLEARNDNVVAFPASAVAGTRRRDSI